MKRVVARVLLLAMLLNLLVMPVRAQEFTSSDELMTAFVDSVFELENREQFVYLLYLVKHIDKRDIMLDAYERSFGMLADGQQARVESFGITLDVVEVFTEFVMTEEFSHENLNTYLGLRGRQEDKEAFKAAMDKRKWDFYGKLTDVGADIDSIVNGFERMDKIFGVLNDLELLKSVGITFPVYETTEEYGDITINEEVFEQMLILVNAKLANKIEDSDSLKDALQVFVDYYNWSYGNDREYTYMYLDYYGWIKVNEPAPPVVTPPVVTPPPVTTPPVTTPPVPVTEEEIIDEEIALAIPTFMDLGGFTWAHDAINLLFGYDIINGKNEAEFDPSGEITRAEFAAMLTRMLELTADDSENPFTDISDSDWFYDELRAAAVAGIINGVSADLFAPGNSVTRQEMATMIGRVLEQRDVAYPVGDELNDLLVLFDDQDDIAPWAKNGVALAAKLEIISGYTEGNVTRFKPTKDATRAEAAVMLYRLAKNVDTVVVVPADE